MCRPREEKAVLGFFLFIPTTLLYSLHILLEVSSCLAIVFSSTAAGNAHAARVLGFRQTKTCQAKWTLIAFKLKLSFSFVAIKVH